jgi:hypothetical protein
MPCPGALFEDLLRDGDRTKAFFEIAKGQDGNGIAHDFDDAMATIDKVQEADAKEEIVVLMAHDESLLGVVDFFPEYEDDFVQKRWVQKVRWRFLRDFVKAVKQPCMVRCYVPKCGVRNLLRRAAQIVFRLHYYGLYELIQSPICCCN